MKSKEPGEVIMEKIAVILVNYNGIKDTIECIESIKESDCYKDITIVVVDNASKNNEAEEIRRKFNDVVAIRSPDNGGFSEGNNFGIRYALDKGAEYITLLNNDTIVDKKMISTLMSRCQSDVVTAPQMLYYDEPNKTWYGGGRIDYWTGNAKHDYMNQIDSPMTERTVTFATGCCMMIGATTLHKVGLLDESYFMYCEDTDFCIRLGQQAIKIKFVPTAKLWHKVSSSTGGSDSTFSTYYMTRNRLNYIKKYKKQFHITAYPFTLMSRYIRMWQCKDETKRKAYRDAICDAKMGKIGRTEGY